MTNTTATREQRAALAQIIDNNGVILTVAERLAQSTKPEPAELEEMKAQLIAARQNLEQISNNF